MFGGRRINHRRHSGPSIYLVHPDGRQTLMNNYKIFLPNLRRDIRPPGMLWMVDVVEKSNFVQQRRVAPTQMAEAFHEVRRAMNSLGREAFKLSLTRTLDGSLRGHSQHRNRLSRYPLCLDLFTCLAELSGRYRSGPIGSSLVNFFLRNSRRIILSESKDALAFWHNALCTAHMDQEDRDLCLLRFPLHKPNLLYDILNNRYNPHMGRPNLMADFTQDLKRAECLLNNQRFDHGLLPREIDMPMSMTMPIRSPGWEFGTIDFPIFNSPAVMMGDDFPEFEDIDELDGGFPFPVTVDDVVYEAQRKIDQVAHVANDALENVADMVQGRFEGPMMARGMPRIAG